MEILPELWSEDGGMEIGEKMFEFIVVHENGEERIVNLRWVDAILPRGGKALICFGSLQSYHLEHGDIMTDESYDAVKKLIWR